jgi:DNA repair exonuclease SbcCD nuclease subunit
MNKIVGPKIACISDIHLGVHQDSQTWHNIALTYANWLRQALLERNITDIIIAGDIFHNRHEIGVNTIHAAHKFFDILKDFNIIAITGNHDCFYKDKSDINSISILNNKNITVFQELRSFTINGKSFAFCPWGTDVKDIPKSDVIVGHFEITNFKMNHHKVCDHGLETESLLDKAKLIISGHFHYREHRKYSNGRSILYLGSPHELDFGDRDQIKGISILDTETLEIDFIENTTSPKHKKIPISKLIDGSINNIDKIVTNNIISLHVDVKTSTQNIDLILTKFGQFKPLQLRTEFSTFEDLQVSTEDLESLSFDIETALHEFVNLLTTDVSKKDILDKCTELYKISQVTNE